MKIKSILTLLLIVLFAGNIFSADRTKFISIEKLSLNSAIIIKLSSKGGHQGFCMEVLFENNTFDTCFAWVEAGRRLISEDEKQQDIFIVKNLYVVIEPSKKKKFYIFGFCCQSHDASPRLGSVFQVGKMEGKDWQAVASVIADHDFDFPAIQYAVWAISNDHPISSIDKGKDDRNLLLLKTIADIKHIELPWYNIDYKQESSQVFSNKPSHIYSEINYNLAYYGEVSIVVRDKYGIVQATLLDGVPKDKGLNAYFFDLDIAGWKDGFYTFEVVQDGNKIIVKRKFEINTKVN